MKRILIFLLVAVIVLSAFASCGKKPVVKDDDESEKITETQDATEAPDNNGNNNNQTNNDANNDNNDTPAACTHNGGTATCKAKAICATCGAEYGELNKTNHADKAQFITTPATHEKLYPCCETVVIKEEAHTWSDGACSVCGHEEYKTITVEQKVVYAGNLLTLNINNRYTGKVDVVNLQDREDRSKIDDGETNSYTVLPAVRERYFATAATAAALNNMMQDFYNATKDRNVFISGAYDNAAIEIQDAIYSSGEAIALSYFHNYDKNGISDQRSIAGVDLYNWIYNNAHKYGFIATYPSSNIFKYIGEAHATAAFEKKVCLNDYLTILNQSNFENPVKINANNTHVAYYCPITEVKVPENYLYEISGNNMDGVIVTVYTDKYIHGDNSTPDEEATVLPFEIANDFTYVLYTANLRATATESATILTEIPFGTKLTRALKNDKWSKVTYTTENGTSYTGYILNDLITTNEDTVTFGNQGVNDVYPIFKLKAGNNYVLRYFPLADGYPHKLQTISKDDLGAVGQLCGGDEVTVLEISKDKMWVKVRSTKVDKAVNGVYNKNYTSTAEGYILYEFLEPTATVNK